MANKKLELDEATLDKINYIHDALYKVYGDDLGGVSIPPPINVVRAGDLQNMKFNAVAPIPKELTDDITSINNGMSAIKAAIEGLPEKLKKKPEPALVPEPNKPEVKEKVSIVKRLSQWINSKVAVYINMALLFASTAFMIIAGLYALRWSDDAWAQRAYDVAVKMDAPNPGKFYHDTRESFRKDHRHAAKGKVLDIEERYRKYKQDSLSHEKGKDTDSNLNKDFR